MTATAETKDYLLRNFGDSYGFLGDAVTVTDHENNFVYVNAACEKLYGYSKDELLCQPVSLIVPPGEIEITSYDIDLAPERKWEGEVFRIRKNGERFPASLILTLLHNEHGGDPLQVAIIRDLTEQKEGEERNRKQAKILDLLAEISRVLDSSPEIEEAYGHFAQVVSRLIPCEGIEIVIPDESSGVATVAYSSWKILDGLKPERSYPIKGSLVGKILRTNTSVHLKLDGIEDIGIRHPVFPPICDIGARSVIGVPLVNEGRIIGILFLYSTTPNFLRQDDIAVSERIGNQIAGAVANSRLSRALEREANQKEVLVQISRIISSSLSIEDVFDCFAECVKKLIPFDRIRVVICDSESKIVVDAYESGMANPAVDPVVPPEKGAFVERLERDGASFIINVGSAEDFAKAVPNARRDIYADFQSTLVSPLLLGGRVIGELVFRACEPDVYRAKDLELAERVAGQIAGTIANSHLHKELALEAKRREVLIRIGRTIGSSLDLSEVYEGFFSLLGELVPYDRIILSQIDIEKGIADNIYVSGVEVQAFRSGIHTPIVGTALESVVLKRASVVHSGGPVLDFVDRFPRMATTILAGLRSLIAVPVIANDRVIAALTLRSKRVNAYSAKEVELVERVAHVISGAIANAQLHSSLQRDARERSVLAELSRVMNSNLDIQKVFELFGDRLREVIPFDRISITTPDPLRSTYVTTYSNGVVVPGQQLGESVSLRGSTIERVISTRKGFIVNAEGECDLEASLPGLIPVFRQGMRSFLVVPLISKGELVAAFNMQAREFGKYDEYDLALAERIGSQIAGAIANSQLHASLERETEERKTLAEIGRSISSSVEVQDLCERLAVEVGKLLQFDRIVISTVDSKKEVLNRNYVGGVKVADRDLGSKRLLGSSHKEPVLRHGVGVIVKYETPEDLFKKFPLLESSYRHGLRSFITVPLISDGTCFGALALSSTECDAYKDQDLVLLESVGDQIAGALSNARLHSEVRREADERTALARISEIITSSTDINEVYEAFTAEVSKLVDFDRIGIRTIDAEDETYSISYASGEQVIGWGQGFKGAFDRTLFQEVIGSQKSLLYNRLDEAKEHNSPCIVELIEAGFKSVLIVPMVSLDGLIGCLDFSSLSRDAYTEKDRKLAENVAVQISGAIANAHLLEQVKASREQLRALSNRIVEVQESERKYIATELHDEIGQVLTSLKINLQIIPKLGPAEAKQRLTQAQEVTNDLLSNVRELSLRLRPAVLDDLGLMAALLWHFKRYTSQTNINVAFTHLGLTERFSSDIEIAVYRIVQESLTNVVRYAEVDNVAVHIEARQGELQIDITDEGSGFDSSLLKDPELGSGMAGMRERVASLGGEFKINSRPTSGTNINATLPLVK